MTIMRGTLYDEYRKRQGGVQGLVPTSPLPVHFNPKAGSAEELGKAVKYLQDLIAALPPQLCK
jgi:hypothetical protein